MPETNVPADAKAGAAHRNAARPRRRRKPPAGWLTVAQLAELGNAAPSTAYHWVATAQVPAARWRGIIIIDEPTAREFLAIKPLLRAGEGAAA